MAPIIHQLVLPTRPRGLQPISCLICSPPCQFPAFVRVLCVYWHWRSRLHVSGTHSTCCRPLSPCAGPARQRRQPAPIQPWLSLSTFVCAWLRWAGHVTLMRQLPPRLLQRRHSPDNLFVGNGEHRDVTPTATPSLFLAFLGQSSLTRLPSPQPTPTADYVTAVSRVCVASWGLTRPTNTSAVGRAACCEVRVGPAA